MIIIPAIDLKQGRCVQLRQGRKEDETVYSDDPSAVARGWEELGASYLHLVDLDGAFEGGTQNLAVVKKVLENIAIPVEFGGGVRSLRTISDLLEMGLDRVILGTLAVQNPDTVRSAVEEFGPDRILAGIDAKDGHAAVEGWVKTSGTSAVNLALDMKAVGIERVVYTDISTDGTLSGPNVEATGKLAIASGLKVIASGGISSIDDLKEIATLEDVGVDGAIVGTALYEGRVDLKEAIEMFREG